MKWKKLGLIFSPPTDLPWMVSHAAVPTAEYLGNDRFRIYFSGRDKFNRSQTGFFEIDIKSPGDTKLISQSPVIVRGDLGTFNDSGSMLSWIVNADKTRYLYFIGWNQSTTVPFRNALGLAILDDDQLISRLYSPGPILDRSILDPYFIGSVCVRKEDHRWRMWYLSGTGWETGVNMRAKHYYHIKYAESSDGIHWQPMGLVCIDFKNKEEYAISRPVVIKDLNTYKMWYSYRGDAYRIGYAESNDGIVWQRMDNLAGISTGATGWDSEMICYPYVFDHLGSRYMIYNGNGYGETGIGLAILEK